jgi:hypothetical protein
VQAVQLEPCKLPAASAGTRAETQFCVILVVLLSAAAARTALGDTSALRTAMEETIL